MAALEEEDDDDDDGEEFEGKKGLEVKAHQASHTNYLMMRGYCSPGIGGVYLLIRSTNVFYSCKFAIFLLGGCQKVHFGGQQHDACLLHEGIIFVLNASNLLRLLKSL